MGSSRRPWRRFASKSCAEDGAGSKLIYKPLVHPTQITAAQEKISITISLGVSTLSSRCNSLASLIKASDKALYIAKETGRDRTIFASS